MPYDLAHFDSHSNQKKAGTKPAGKHVIPKLLHPLLTLATLLGFQWLGHAVVTLFQVAIPGPLMGMALFLLALCAYGRLPGYLKASTNLLLGHLMLLFIPSVVGIMTQADVIATHWLAFLFSCLVGTACTLFITAFTLKRMLAYRSHHRD